MRAHKRAALGMVVAGALSMVLPVSALAEPISCDSDADYKCTFDISSFEMQEVPSIFRFQARVSQAKFPVGDAEFSSLTVKVEKSDGEVLCQEQFRNVQVRDSVLNLEVGRMMTCKLDEEVRDNNNLKFTVCFGGNQCLKPISMGSVPYSVKSTFAKQAQQAYRAQEAAQAHYAHRMTADTSIFANPQIGTGYFDFETPKVAPGQQVATGAALGIGYDTDFRPYQHDGFIQWAQVTAPEGATFDSRLHICSKNLTTNKIETLDELVVHATLSRFRGQIIVAAEDVDGEADRGLVVFNGAQVLGHLDVSQNARIEGNSEIVGTSLVRQMGTFESNVLIQEGADIARTGGSLAAPALIVRDSAHLQNGVNAEGGVHIWDTTPPEVDEREGYGLLVKDGAKFVGSITVREGNVDTPSVYVGSGGIYSTGVTYVDNQIRSADSLWSDGWLYVAGESTLNDVDVRGDLEVSDSAVLPGANFNIGGSSNVTVTSPAIFNGDVVFNGEVSLNGDPAIQAKPSDGSIDSASQFAGRPITAANINFGSFGAVNTQSELFLAKRLTANELDGPWTPSYWNYVTGQGGASMVNLNRPDIDSQHVLIQGNNAQDGANYRILMHNHVTVTGFLQAVDMNVQRYLTVQDQAIFTGGMKMEGGVAEFAGDQVLVSTGNLSVENGRLLVGSAEISATSGNISTPGSVFSFDTVVGAQGISIDYLQGIYPGNGSGATRGRHDLKLRGYQGLGMSDSLGNVRGVYDFLEGSWDLDGGIILEGSGLGGTKDFTTGRDQRGRGILRVGTEAGVNIRMDSNEIQAASNADAGNLHLNWRGGMVKVGSGGLHVDGNVAIGIVSAQKKLHVEKGELRVRASHNNTWADIGAFYAENMTQGIGIGFNRIQALGANLNQDIRIIPRGAGKVFVDGPLTVSGELTVGGKSLHDQIRDYIRSNCYVAIGHSDSNGGSMRAYTHTYFSGTHFSQAGEYGSGGHGTEWQFIGLSGDVNGDDRIWLHAKCR